MMLWDLDEDTPDTEGLVRDLIIAHTLRDVDVQVIMGDPTEKDDEGSIRHRNKAAYNLLTDPKVYIPTTVCDESCLPGPSGKDKGIMHMKFFLFSDSDTVVHTSSNLSNGQYKRHQNLLALKQDEKMYNNYLSYWQRMKRGSWDGWSSDTDRAREGDTAGSKAYYFPREKLDPIAGTLGKLKCPNSDGASDNRNEKVWVAASIFHKRKQVTDALNILWDRGCDVRVIVGDQTVPGTDGEVSDMEWVQNNTHIDPRNIKALYDPGGDWNAHHNKLIVTDAEYEKKPRKAVYAGSHNLGNRSLRHSSDGTLRVANSSVYGYYEQYYKTMFEEASPIPASNDD